MQRLGSNRLGRIELLVLGLVIVLAGIFFTPSGYPIDYGWTLPDEVFAVPESQREKEARFDSDRCRFGDRYFLRGVLELPFLDQPGYYGWALWVEVEPSTFKRLNELHDSAGSDEPRASGRIANQPPGYENLLGHEVEIQVGTRENRPTLWFPPESTHRMAKEQRSGIDSRRYQRILRGTGIVVD